MEDHHFSTGPLKLHRLIEENPENPLKSFRRNEELLVDSTQLFSGEPRNGGLNTDENLFEEEIDSNFNEGLTKRLSHKVDTDEIAQLLPIEAESELKEEENGRTTNDRSSKTIRGKLL